jgi:hypothetical protein
VARCTDPCWLPAFGVAAGLVTEIGGWLSHAAIQAREHDLATVVGVVDATRWLHTGDLVRLKRNGAIERVLERRRPRERVDLPGQLQLGDRLHAIHVRDLGDDGAGIEVDDPRLLPAVFELRIGGATYKASLAWRNCARVGVKFDTTRLLRPEVASPESGESTRKPFTGRTPAGR